jgi:hypothetical protein
LKSISLHYPQVIKTKKFIVFKKALRCSPLEAAGLLGLILGHALDLNPTGELSDWNSEFLSELLGLEDTRSELAWEALVMSGWLEVREDRVFVNDWIEIAGPALIEKFRFIDRQRLVNIWALHGQSYGREPRSPKVEGHSELDEDPTVGLEKAHSEFTVSPPKAHSEFAVDPEKRNKRGISLPSDFRAAPPHTPPSSKDTTQKDVSLEPWETGSKETTPRGVEIENILPNDRRDKKARPEIHLLLERFQEHLTSLAGEPVTFAFPVWGRFLKLLLTAKPIPFPAAEIERRFIDWCASTDRYCRQNRNNAGVFYNRFNDLKDGPITANQVGAHGGAKRFNDGEGNSPFYEYKEPAQL